MHEVLNRLEERERVIQQILQTVQTRGFHTDTYFHRLCLDEALTNAIVHGNSGDPAKRVTIHLFCSDRSWGVEIADQGPGFDWQSWKPQSQQGLAKTGPSGRGIALIWNSGAQVTFLEGGSRIRMVWKGTKG